MPFTYAHHQAIEKAKIESKLMARFHDEISELRRLGFDELHFVREIAFPLSALFLPFAMPLMMKSREIWQVGRFLQIIAFNPLLYNYEFDTYGHIMGLGVTFVTRFTDGTALISCGYKSERVHAPEQKVHCFVLPNRSIAESWREHREAIGRMEGRHYQTDNELSLEKYTAIIQESDRLSISRGYRKAKRG